MKDVADQLLALGLSEKSSRAYLAILQIGPSTIKPIADFSGLKRTSIYNFIDTLVELGLVSRRKRNGRWYYSAEDPRRLVRLQQERMRDLSSALPTLAQLFLRGQRKIGVNFFEGAKEVKNILLEELSCKREALYLWPGRDVIAMAGGARFLSAVDRARVKKGVWVKSIHFRDKLSPYSTSSSGDEFLRESRFAPPMLNLSMGMGIYDCGKVGFFSSARENFGILVTSTELEQAMRGIFSFVWAHSEPARIP